MPCEDIATDHQIDECFPFYRVRVRLNVQVEATIGANEAVILLLELK